MFTYTTPENQGISSADIKKYIKLLENSGLSTHDVIISKGDAIVYENYWAPFHKDFLHRMYSVTKSYVGIAVGFLEQDGLVSLDDKIIKYFPEEMENQTDENFKNQTIRDMLMMSTAKLPESWFINKPEDRVKFYFSNKTPQSRPSGTIFQYDSTGSFVLGALVERLTKKTLVDYLREKALDKIGFSKEAYCLKCPGGHSWGDSGLICTAQDLLKTARFVLNGGKWNGEQLLNKEFVQAATSNLIQTNQYGHTRHDHYGYGYLIWRGAQNSFAFNGMGCQFAICVPHKDLILIYNGDNQGNGDAGKIIIDNFFSMIVDNACDTALSENKPAHSELLEYSKGLKLFSAKGESKTPFEQEINGVWYDAEPNPMGISKFRLVFEHGEGRFEYTNEQGDKTIKFGMCENVFDYFPQEGYSNEIGTVPTKDFYYKCAASAAWIEPHKIFIKVQIIDTYFGNLAITIGFKDDLAGMFMTKTAEFFMQEYIGYASAKKQIK